MSVFGSFKFGEEVFGGTGGGISPTPDFNERVPWIIANYSGGQTYAFEINPLDATVPSFKRTITTQSTAAGRQINYEGRRQPQTITVSGTILSEDQYNMLDAWARVRKQVKVTDDLGGSPGVISVPPYNVALGTGGGGGGGYFGGGGGGGAGGAGNPNDVFGGGGGGGSSWVKSDGPFTSGSIINGGEAGPFNPAGYVRDRRGFVQVSGFIRPNLQPKCYVVKEDGSITQKNIPTFPKQGLEFNTVVTIGSGDGVWYSKDVGDSWVKVDGPNGLHMKMLPVAGNTGWVIGSVAT